MIYLSRYQDREPTMSYARTTLQTLFIVTLSALLGACAEQSYPYPDSEPAPIPAQDPNAKALIETSRYVDTIKDELSTALSDELFDSKVELRKTQSDTLQLTISGDDAFRSGHTRLNKTILSVLDRIAGVMEQQPNSIVHIVSHTDSTGSDQTNLTISEKRATVVANHLERKGIQSERLISMGRGEHEPIMPNDNPAQQALNRRIEIYVRGITNGNEGRAYETPSI